MLTRHGFPTSPSSISAVSVMWIGLEDVTKVTVYSNQPEVEPFCQWRESRKAEL